MFKQFFASMRSLCTKHSARLTIGLVLTAFFAAQMLGFIPVKFINQVDNIFYDARLQWTMPGGIDDRIVIVDVDEKSLVTPELGRWPWSRDKMARIMDTLFEHYQIRLLGFDVIWAEPDTSSGFTVLQKLSKTELKGDAQFAATVNSLAKRLDYDAIFAQSLENRPVVLGYYFNSNQDATEIGLLPEPIFLKDDLAGRQTQFAVRKGYGANLEKITFAAPLAGHFNPTVDTDGVIRRVPLIAQYQNDYYESLSLAMYRLYLAQTKPGQEQAGIFPARIPGAQLEPAADPKSGTIAPIEAIRVDGMSIPVGLGTNALVPFRGRQHSFPYISLADVYNKSVPKEQLQNKILIVGTTAPGLADLRATPVGGLFPGVEVHANLLAGMLDLEKGGIKSIPPFMLAGEFVAIVVLGITLTLCMALMSAISSAIVLVLSVGLVLLANISLWQAGFAMPIASLLFLIFAIYIGNIAYGYFVESRNKRQLADLFGSYVPPELVEQMAENPLQYNMVAKKAHLTVLFADIVGFTSISESLSPQELTAFVNEYLSEMSATIRSHGGTLDKYIGDAIMAFWGAPIDDVNHATHGVTAALAMQEKLQELKTEYAKRGWPDIKVGLGLSTGDMTVGDMGSKIRKAYTVMGDSVNLGSRLEGITRIYGVGILVSESTQASSNGIVYREIDIVRVKGKENPVCIYEPIALEGALTGDTRASLDKWHAVLKDYRSQAWQEAEDGLIQLQATEPDCKLYVLYRARIAQWRTTPPPANWDGVTQFDTK
jgi:adenylate cyclase